ncbi:hypothetical protein FSB78_10660 [Sphingomonas ginsenosidivorax]|uniref:Uncharacterized protein n=1 Tax=Sphingomonas ginsenosidivorax TaxID=862135 RepID=A0A5C6UFY7_9SPHN|nr:hypothetical protein [Sphingomonas ginsenosidivorax]TXC71350.1 hypothetical protein FSB78_10660 [Sphingomonas ginsenosidivorax]
MFLDASPAGFAAMDPTSLPGDVWMRIVRTRPRKDVLFMGEHMILWVQRSFRSKSGFGDIVRNADND